MSVLQKPYRDHNIGYRLISRIIPESGRVLDLGCGTGELLYALMKEKNILGQGVEIDENMVVACLKKGVSVIQANIDEGLKDHPDKSYDYVILNQTLQSVYKTEFVMSEMLRVGKRAIIGIPNFAYFKIRLTLGFHGRLPVTRVFGSEWYNTPNIRLVTVKDFKSICKPMGIRIVNQFYMVDNNTLGPVRRLVPNLFSENALFEIEKK